MNKFFLLQYSLNNLRKMLHFQNVFLSCNIVGCIIGCNRSTKLCNNFTTIAHMAYPMDGHSSFGFVCFSYSYTLEIQKLWPAIKVTGVACPFWVPLVEYGEANSPGADYFVKKRMDELMARDPLIDTVILGCTHYPLLLPKIKKYASPNVRIVPQGEYVAHSLQDYLSRHPEMESRLTKEGTCHYLTTENSLKFQESAQIFLHEKVDVEHIAL